MGLDQAKIKQSHLYFIPSSKREPGVVHNWASSATVLSIILKLTQCVWSVLDNDIDQKVYIQKSLQAWFNATEARFPSTVLFLQLFPVSATISSQFTHSRMRSGNNLGVCFCDEFSSVLGNVTTYLYYNNQNKPLQNASDQGIRGTKLLNHVFHRLQEMELTLPKHLQKVYFSQEN